MVATTEAGLRSCVGSLRLKVRPYDQRPHVRLLPASYCYHKIPECIYQYLAIHHGRHDDHSVAVASLVWRMTFPVYAGSAFIR